jgi:hypothetical protein
MKALIKEVESLFQDTSVVLAAFQVCFLPLQPRILARILA